MAYCKVLQWIYQKQPPEVLYKIAFSTEYPQMTASEFLQKDIDKFKECQTNESTKKIHLRRKKESMEQRETNSNAVTEGLATTDKG